MPLERAPLVLREVLERLLAGESLSEVDAQQLLVQLTDEALSPAMVGALLVALRAKGVVANELRGFAKGMRALARRPDLPDTTAAVDVVGTGGDGSGSVNLSTGTALVVAAAGVPVVKHGNRSISSRSGSADLLEALGLPLPLQGAAIGECLSATGFTFVFAPHHHPAMKAVAPVRGALGIRTVFNLLGPLTNPAAPPFGLIGTFDFPTARLLAEAFAGMPVQRVFVVQCTRGWDEPTPCAPFNLFDVQSPPAAAAREAGTLATVTHTLRDPLTDYGLPRCTPEELAGGDGAHNAERLLQVLRGEDRGAHRHALLLGTALVLELTGRVATPAEGIAVATAAIDSGAALRLVTRLRAFGDQLRGAAAPTPHGANR